MTTDSLEYVNVADIAVDANIRKNTKITPSWVSSIRNHGILNPTLGWRDNDGIVHLTDGQRRYLAAVDIGLPQIPVIIKPKALAEEARIVAQLTLNEQREPIDDSEHMTAIAELAQFGVTPTMIARKTNKPRAFIDQALTVASNPTASTAITTHQLTLDQAAIIAELSDDPDDVAKLEQTATENPTHFEHVAQRIRDDRAEAIIKTELREQIKAAGAEEISSFYSSGAEVIRSLWRADDENHTRITVDDLTQYSDIVATLGRNWDYDAGAERWMIIWGIRGWKQQGLATHGSGGTAGPLSDEEKAARKAKREAKAAMISATTVRRGWLRTHLLTGRLLSDEEYRWIALAAIGAPGVLRDRHRDNDALELAAQLLDITIDNDDASGWDGEHYSSAETLALTPSAHGRTPLRIALAVAIAHTEYVVGNPKADSFGQDPRAAIYLEQLEQWGYTLAPVEQAIITAAVERAAARATARAEREARDEAAAIERAAALAAATDEAVTVDEGAGE